MKKFTAALLSAAMLFTLILGMAPADAQVENPFSDVPSYQDPQVNYVYENQYMSGFSDNTFRPDANAKRAQVANAIWRKAGSPQAGGDCAEVQDIQDSWAVEAICWMLDQGYATGFSDGFHPEANITRAQAASWLGKAHHVVYTGGYCNYSHSAGPNFSDVSTVYPVYWAANEICGLTTSNIVDGYSDNTFRPGNNITRIQFTTWIWKLRYVTAS